MDAIKRKHQQLFDILKDEFQRGLYPKGSKLPKIMELARKHSVSVNIATKAVELLKEAGYATAKAGDGIYSVYEEQNTQRKGYYAGERIFSFYGQVKRLNLHVEDSREWQINFWKRFFGNFCQKNPDIELCINYGNHRETEKKSDMLLGGVEFFNKCGNGLDELFEYNELEIFADNMYRDMLLSPSDLSWNGKNALFPYAFILPVLLHKEKDLPPSQEGNIIDYIKRLKDLNKGGPTRYKTCSLQTFFINIGCCSFNSNSGKFGIQKRTRWLNCLDAVRSFYQNEDILALHGYPLDYDKIFDHGLGNDIRFVEYQYNALPGIKKYPYKITKYPLGENFPMIPMCGYIMKDTRFPEECLRLIKELLRVDMQRQLLKSFTGFPIHPEAMKGSEYEYLTERCKNATRKYFVVPPDPLIGDAIRTMLTWELYYYFLGKISGDILPRLEKKIQIFMENGNRGASENE